MEYDLDRIHSIQLNMALELKKICEENNINYFLVAGTLLGAIRHKGFIPWDDDLDIGMLRVDYEKFLLVCNEKLSSKYYLQTWNTDKKFGLPIAKLRLKGTKYIEKSSANVDMECGIYIDIFPFDNVPESKIKKNIQSSWLYVLKRIILIKIGYELWADEQKIKKFVYKIIKYSTGILSIDFLKKKLHSQMIKYNKCNASEVVAVGGAYGYKKETINRKWLEDLYEIKFENEIFTAPKRAHEYLNYFYGDYMTPPPMDKRYNRHQIQEIDYGGY